MFELTAENALGYLQETEKLPRGESARVEPLAWGVSNLVLRVSPSAGDDFVIKQSRAQLRTKDPWYSRLDRIWREVGVMRVLEPLLARRIVPRILFEDRENFLFGMEAAPANHVVWKQKLLEGEADSRIAARLGAILGTIHCKTAFNAELQDQWGDTEVFVQLRVDPFYRRIAALDPEVRPCVQSMIDEMFATAVSMVHADFSPKNVLLSAEGIMLVDFETGHFGDPAFDLGFFLSHLLLKAVLHAERFAGFSELTTVFWKAYFSELGDLSNGGPFGVAELTRRTVSHLAGCMWARIDGTSKIDYLQDERRQTAVRRFCRSLFLDPPAEWPDILERLRTGLQS